MAKRILKKKLSATSTNKIEGKLQPQVIELEKAVLGALMIDNESLFVSCSDYFLKILLLQAEGKRAMKAEDWVRGINKESLIEFI